jgi:hypothetical protein
MNDTLYFSYEGAFFGLTSDKHDVPAGCRLTGRAYTRKPGESSITYSLVTR